MSIYDEMVRLAADKHPMGVDYFERLYPAPVKPHEIKSKEEVIKELQTPAFIKSCDPKKFGKVYSTEKYGKGGVKKELLPDVKTKMITELFGRTK